MKKILFIVLVLGVNFVSALSFTVNTPVADEMFDSRRVEVDLVADERANFYYKDEIFGTRGWRRLCMRTEHCTRRIIADEGHNDISFKVVNMEGEQEFIYNIPFYVDSRDPRILSTEPRRNRITNGNIFSVRFLEENLKKVILYYGIYGDMREEERTDCGYGRGWCHFEDVDLTDFDGKEIEYWFSIEDEVEKEESRKRTIDVDVTPPEINQFDFKIVRRNRASFIFEVIEDNFDIIEYIDHSSRRPRWRRLCSRIRDGSCNRVKRFRRGEHILDIRIADEAGNQVMITEDMRFTI